MKELTPEEAAYRRAHSPPRLLPHFEKIEAWTFDKGQITGYELDYKVSFYSLVEIK